MINKAIKTTVVISLLLFLLWLPLWYFAKPVNDFCNSINRGNSYEIVVSKAKELNFRVFDAVKEHRGLLSVETQNSPFFRMGCFISFKDNKVIERQVRNFD